MHEKIWLHPSSERENAGLYIEHEWGRPGGKKFWLCFAVFDLKTQEAIDGDRLNITGSCFDTLKREAKLNRKKMKV